MPALWKTHPCDQSPPPHARIRCNRCIIRAGISPGYVSLLYSYSAGRVRDRELAELEVPLLGFARTAASVRR
jgi:hypothetical protein